MVSITHHSQSPYNAFDGNPVFWADPSGADVTLTGQAAQDAFGALKDEINSRPKKREEELEYDESEENDDIRFRNKKGKVIATYYTNDIDDDVELPFDIDASNIDLNALIAEFSGMEDLDVVGFGGDWNFTAAMGGGISLEVLYFLDGKNKGEYEFYKTKSQNVGVKAAAGLYAIFGNYHGPDNLLNRYDYLGRSFSLSLDVKTKNKYGLSGTSIFWAARDPNAKWGMESLFDKSERLWTGYTIGTGYGGGLQYSKNNTTLLKKD